LTARPFVVTASPVSRAFRDRLEAEVGGTVDVLDLAQLRRLPVPSLLRTLSTHRGRPALLAVEDETTTSVLPVLHAVAAVARPSSIEVVRADLSRERRTKEKGTYGVKDLG